MLYMQLSKVTFSRYFFLLCVRAHPCHCASNLTSSSTSAIDRVLLDQCGSGQGERGMEGVSDVQRSSHLGLGAAVERNGTVGQTRM